MNPSTFINGGPSSSSSSALHLHDSLNGSWNLDSMRRDSSMRSSSRSYAAMDAVSCSSSSTSLTMTDHSGSSMSSSSKSRSLHRRPSTRLSRHTRTSIATEVLKKSLDAMSARPEVDTPPRPPPPPQQQRDELPVIVVRDARYSRHSSTLPDAMTMEAMQKSQRRVRRNGSSSHKRGGDGPRPPSLRVGRHHSRGKSSSHGRTQHALPGTHLELAIPGMVDRSCTV